MNIVANGTSYQIFSNGVSVSQMLPVQTYRVAFSSMSGYSLESIDTEDTPSTKTYGTIEHKVRSTLSAFAEFDRSLGVMLSGDKGIGKSLFARMLSEEARKKGIPTIRVEQNTPGLSEFLQSIDQEVLILFDEFEKVFPENADQVTLLGLFDGICQHKHLYVITVNRIFDISEYFRDRPGRIHYHYRFEYPTADEIHTYLMDQLKDIPNKEAAIDEVKTYSIFNKLNYDSLRAIAFELNIGNVFSEIVNEINIPNARANDAIRMSIKFEGIDKEISVGSSNIRLSTAKPCYASARFHDPKEDAVYDFSANFDSDNMVVNGYTVTVTEGITIEWDSFDTQNIDTSTLPNIEKITIMPDGRGISAVSVLGF